MKNLHLCLIILPFLFSCDSDTETPYTPPLESFEATAREGDVIPANTDNAYDLAGRIHNEILSAYYQNDSLPITLTAVSELIDEQARLNPGFVSMAGVFYSPAPTTALASMLNNPSSYLQDVLAASDLSTDAKTSLSGFYSSILSSIDRKEAYEITYDTITLYENGVISSNVLTHRDKEIILTTTSIARYSTFLRKKKPRKNTDPDWDWMTGNIISGTNGAEFGPGQAITSALKAGIMQNQ